MSEFADNPEERLAQEAEELMRQGRYQDAAGRYQQLRAFMPTDALVGLGHASALECAGEVREAERIVEETAEQHGRNQHVLRFRTMFFERREDYARAAACRSLLQGSPDPLEEPTDILADLYFNQGRYHEARSELERILREETVEENDIKASLSARLGACLRQQGELEEAREKLLGALAIEGTNHWTLAELAETERALGNADGARKRYLQALETNPDDHWCRGHLAQLEHEQGNSSKAVELYEEILASQPKATWALVELGQVLGTIDPERSKQLCSDALEQDPNYPWASAQLGHLARAQGDLEQARQHYQQALAASPTATWILHELADTCRHLGRVEEAFTHLEHARNLQPFEAASYGYMADILRSEDRFPEAIANLNKAVELDPNYSWAWRELTEIHAQENRHEEAAKCFAEAERLEPGDPINEGLKAYLLRCQDKREEAIPHLRRAVDKQRDYVWAWRELLEHLLALGRNAEAEATSREALEAAGEHPSMQMFLAESLRRQGRRDEAHVETLKALAGDPKMPALWAMRAELESDTDSAAALNWARKAVELDSSPEYRILLGQLLVANGHDGEASEVAAGLVAEHPQIAAGWNLCADIADRQGHPDAAMEAVQQGLKADPTDLRLLLRAARIEVQTDKGPGLERLQVLWDAPGTVPWRDAAQLYAQGGKAIECRRALGRLVDAAQDNTSSGVAWLSWAECAMLLGDRDEARVATDRALEYVPHMPGALILSAMLADQSGDHRLAIIHLESLRNHQKAFFADGENLESTGLLRQLARLHEITGNGKKATALWETIATRRLDGEAVIDLANARMRQGADDQAAQLLDKALEDQGCKDHTEQLIQARAMVAFRSGGHDQAEAYLLANRERIGPDNRELLARLQLGSGDHQAALATLDEVEPATAQGTLQRDLLKVRALLAAQQHAEALGLAQSCVNRAKDSEEAAILLAEALAYAAEFQQALEVLRNEALPSRPGTERLLLGAALLLEHRSVADAVTWLAHGDEAAFTQPLGRLLAAAWPGLTSTPAQPSAEDIRSLPPFPRMAERLGQALIKAGHTDLGTTVLISVAEAARLRGQVRSSRELMRLAVRPLRVLGRRRAALGAALAARAPLHFLRSLLPI